MRAGRLPTAPVPRASGVGYIDWHRLSRSEQHAEIADGRQTYVYAYWLVDYGRAVRDQGVSLLKREDSHPDWFIHAENADHVLAAYCHPRTVVSPQFSTVYDDNLAARPLLAAMLLGTSDRFYRTSHTRPRHLVVHLRRLELARAAAGPADLPTL